MTEKSVKIAVIGGTGALGGGFAFRLAQAGYPVVIGSGTHHKAHTAAAELNQAINPANAVVAEALTSILIGVNKHYKVDGAGIRITGIE